jgi:ADP-heptose:LPS heptosyltransferase
VDREEMQSCAVIRKVLIYRTGSLGDTLVALPCFHLVARTFPNARRVLLANVPVHSKAPAALAVLGDSGLVHGGMSYAGATRNIWEMLRLMWMIRRFHPDLLVYMMPIRSLKSVSRDRLFFRLAGVRRIVGLPSAENLKHRLNAATGLYEPEASRLARTIAALGDARPADIANWDLRLTIPEREAGARVLGDLKGRPLIGCGPGTKMQAKDWGQEKWRALLGRIGAKYPSYGLAMIGVQEEAGFCDEAFRDWTGAKVNLAGMLSPRESAAVISQATLFIGTDSGPMHLAASVGVPCVCVFSAIGLPGVWFPIGERNTVIYHQTECYGCGLETCVIMDKKCIRSVTVDEMEQAVDRALGPTAHTNREEIGAMTVLVAPGAEGVSR